jgi:hypothetical protein
MGRFNEVLTMLKNGIFFQDSMEIMSALNLAKDLHINLDEKLIEDANSILLQNERRNILRELYISVQKIPRGKLELLVKNARNLTSININEIANEHLKNN